MKACFHTLGCKVNQYETQAMKEQFLAAGHEVVGEEDVADCYIINTCTVTALADRKSRQAVRRMKRMNPDAVICVTGCYVEVDPDAVSSIEGVDLVLGNAGKRNIVEHISGLAKEATGEGIETSADAGTAAGAPDDFKEDPWGNEQRAEKGLGDAPKTAAERENVKNTGKTPNLASGITDMSSRTRAYIKIEDGCDRFCSYCVIPYARGPVRSRPEDEILKEAESLIRRGFSELILTGINTALYEDLPGLLTALDQVSGDFRVRLSSLEPTVVNADSVEKLFGCERLCHHLHLSLQAGSDHVLGLMNRRYGMKEYMEIVKRLKDFDPYYGITTDIICGFPGETEEDFRESLKTVSDAGFCRVHAFNYSRRKGTKASEMPGQIPPDVRKERVKRLIRCAGEAQSRFAEANAGRTETVIFEQREGEMMTGYTGNYIKAYAPYDESAIGRLAKVRIASPYSDGVLAERVR